MLQAGAQVCAKLLDAEGKPLVWGSKLSRSEVSRLTALQWRLAGHSS